MGNERTQEELLVELKEFGYRTTDAAAALIERQAAEIARLQSDNFAYEAIARAEAAEAKNARWQSEMDEANREVLRLIDARKAAEAEARQLREQLEECRKSSDFANRGWIAQNESLREQLAACERDAARFVALMPDADGKTLLNMPRVHPPFDFKCEQRYTNIDALRAAIDGAVAKKGG